VNVGKFEKRKGVDLLLNAYAKNFYNKDVRLLGLWSNPFNKDWAKEIHESLTSLGFSKVDTLANRNIYRLNDCKVELVGRLSDRRFVATMIKAADCAVYPHRAEGWGLPIIESMALGVPTIATFYSGPTEYLTPENAELIHVSQLESAVDGQFFRGDRGNWAVVEEDLVAAAMLKAYDNIEDIPSDPYGVIESWSWKHAAEVASKFIEEVEDGNDVEEQRARCPI
jgi:glycosyltransferase involved in cell wall biosynthesis